jgi:hypothetical protein
MTPGAGLANCPQSLQRYREECTAAGVDMDVPTPRKDKQKKVKKTAAAGAAAERPAGASSRAALREKQLIVRADKVKSVSRAGRRRRRRN